ncbi:MAG: DUF481 domain-containing protein [Verrucomicrobiota bacterium]
MNRLHSNGQNGARYAAQAAMLGFALLLADQARGDSVCLRGGEKLIGKIVSQSAANIVFESQTLGPMEIARDRIERMECDAPAPVSTNQFGTSAAGLPSQCLPWTSEPAQGAAFDWIQLKSGEWLAGKIKSLQEEKLEFDSEELNLLTFDWQDIRTMRSLRLNSVRIEKLKAVDGSVFVTSNEVQVTTSTTTNTYPRADLLAIAPTGNRELDKWSGKVSAGVSFRAGNTKETDANAHAALQRRTPDTRLSLDYLGNYSKLNGAEVEENHRFTGQFDYFLSRRLYARLPDFEYYRDPLQNLSHRITVGAGVGYDLVKTPRTEWNVTVSPSWQRDWFESVPATENASPDSVALVLSTRFDVELTQRLDLLLEYRGQLSRKETGNDTHHAVTTLEFEIHKRLKLDLSFVWGRISSPQTESGGDTPTPDDFRLITSLGVDF